MKGKALFRAKCASSSISLSIFAVLACLTLVLTSCAQGGSGGDAKSPDGTSDDGSNPLASISASLWYVDDTGKVRELSTGTDPEITGFDHSVDDLLYYRNSVYYLSRDTSGSYYTLYQWKKDAADRVVRTRIECSNVGHALTDDGLDFTNGTGGVGSGIKITQISLSSGAEKEVPGLDAISTSASHPFYNIERLFATNSGLLYAISGSNDDNTSWWGINRLVGSEASGTGSNDEVIVPKAAAGSHFMYYNGTIYRFLSFSSGIEKYAADGTWTPVVGTNCFDAQNTSQFFMVGPVDQSDAGISFPILPTAPDAELWYTDSDTNAKVYTYLDGPDEQVSGFDYPVETIGVYGKSLYYVTSSESGKNIRLVQWKKDAPDRIVCELPGGGTEVSAFAIASDAVYYRAYSSGAYSVRKLTVADGTDEEVPGFDAVSYITGIYALTDGLYYSVSYYDSAAKSYISRILKKNGTEQSGTGYDDTVVNSGSADGNASFACINYYDGFWYSFSSGGNGLYKANSAGVTLRVTDQDKSDYMRSRMAYVKDLDQNETGITVAGGSSGTYAPGADIHTANASMALSYALAAAVVTTDSTKPAYNTFASGSSSGSYCFTNYTASNGVVITGSINVVMNSVSTGSIVYNGTLTIGNDGDVESIAYDNVTISGTSYYGYFEYTIAGVVWKMDCSTSAWSKK